MIDKWGDKATITIHKSISNYNLIIFPFCDCQHWFTFMFIKIDNRMFILIQIGSLNNEARKGISEELINWFNSSPEVKKHKLTISTYYPPGLSTQNDQFSCGPFLCIHVFNASILSSKFYSQERLMLKFRELMDNALTSNHTIHDFRNELSNFCLSIKCPSTKDISKENVTMSSSFHYIKLKSCIKDMSLTPNGNIDNIVDIPSDSYFPNSISLSDFETSFYKYVKETNKGICIIDLELHHKNYNIMNNSYDELKKYFDKPDTCCTSSEWYLNSIVFRSNYTIFNFKDNNAKVGN